MKHKNIFRVVILTFLILFISIYVTQATGYYEYQNSKKTTLTKEQISEFEKDLKENKEIDTTKYITEQKDYSNIISNTGMGISKLIDDSFNGIMKLIFKEVEKSVNSQK